MAIKRKLIGKNPCENAKVLKIHFNVGSVYTPLDNLILNLNMHFSQHINKSQPYLEIYI